MNIKTIPFDAARYLTAPEVQVEMLSDALASGDAGYIANVLEVIARARGLLDVARGARITTRKSCDQGEQSAKRIG